MANIWADRKFEFEFDFTRYREFIGRLRETPNHLNTMVAEIPDKLYRIKHAQEWSIQENAGHLISVDYLFIARLHEYEEGRNQLSPADMSGASTNRENYNSESMQKLLDKFAENRGEYVLRLDNLDAAIFNRRAWHPRLEKEMRLCDMLYFQAEHDAHHLDKIRSLYQYLSQNT